MLKEFKAFAMRGNIMDLAVGVIIGGAFGKIVASLVNDLLMPIIGMFFGGVNFTELRWVITPATATTAEAAIRYGAFLQSIVDFVIIAFSIFMIIKALNSTKKKAEEAPAAPPAPPAPSKEEILLGEIRDILKSR